MSTVKSRSRLNKTGKPKNGRLRHLDIYIDAGMRVVGLNGKRPAETGWPGVPFRPRNQIPLRHWERLKFNFGWVLDDSNLVIDVDRHSGGADGWQSLTRLVDDLGIYPLDEITPASVKTGGGGHHLYFSKPEGMRIRKTIPEYPGIDFCSKGQQVVAVGAIHPKSGRPYSFSKPFGSETLRNLPEAPEALLKLLSESTPDNGNVLPQRTVDFHEHKLIIAALSHIDPDIDYLDWIKVLLALHSVQDSDSCFSIADGWSSMGWKYDANGPDSVEAKWKSFDKNPMREPRIAIGTLFKLGKAAGWGGSARHLGPSCWDQEVDGSQFPADTRPKSEPVPITNILATEFKELRFIVSDLIPDIGLFILSSNPKVGKTTFCHQMFLALMGGVPFLGNVNPKPRRILFLALEDSARRIKHRTKQILDAPDFDLRNPNQALDGLMVVTDWPSFPDGLDKLDEWLLNNPDTELVVIDTLAAFRGMAATGSRSVYQQEYELMKQIKKVADKHEMSILLTHHNRKAQSNSPGEAIGGSYGLTGAVDGYMVLESRGFADAEFLLSVQGRDIPPQEIALKRENFVFRSLGDASMYTMSVERREIIELLENNPRGLGPMDVADKLGRQPASTRKLLTTMQKRGLIKKIQHGVYAPQ